MKGLGRRTALSPYVTFGFGISGQTPTERTLSLFSEFMRLFYLHVAPGHSDPSSHATGFVGLRPRHDGTRHGASTLDFRVLLHGRGSLRVLHPSRLEFTRGLHLPRFERSGGPGTLKTNTGHSLRRDTFTQFVLSYPSPSVKLLKTGNVS